MLCYLFSLSLFVYLKFYFIIIYLFTQFKLIKLCGTQWFAGLGPARGLHPDLGPGLHQGQGRGRALQNSKTRQPLSHRPSRSVCVRVRVFVCV